MGGNLTRYLTLVDKMINDKRISIKRVKDVITSFNCDILKK